MSLPRFAVLLLGIACVAADGYGQPLERQVPTLANWAAPLYWSRAGAPPHGVTAAATTETTLAGPLPFFAVTPCRLVDTRSDGSGAYTDGETRVYDFSTNTNCTGLPSTPQAWSLNIAMQVVSHQAFLTAWPDGESQPVVAALVAYPTGLFYTNAAIVPTGNGDKIDVYCQYAANVVIDVNGYYAAAGGSGSGGTWLTGGGIGDDGFGGYMGIGVSYFSAATSAPSPMTGTIDQLTVNLTNSNCEGSHTFTLMVNGNNTAVTCTLTAPAGCSDTSHSVAVNAGDLVVVYVPPTGACVADAWWRARLK